MNFLTISGSLRTGSVDIADRPRQRRPGQLT